MNKKTVSKNAYKANVIAERCAKVIDDRMEKILLDAENVVKEHFPARYVSASLTRLRVILKNEGIMSNFDKRVSREALRRTASMQCSKEDCDEAIGEIAKAIVAETNAVLDQCDKAISAAVEKHCTTKRISNHRVRLTVEAKMNKTGLKFKF